ncbi:hypothetical protein [Micromonospora sp. NPDC023956]|uniref:hypothetical protein n=1 Tax=Micromonospora sp. NPDC023956 TaxID=3155722 RepID=UPI00340D4A37
MTTRLTPRVRRSVLTLLTAAATTLLLSVTSATAAPLDRSGDAGTQATPVDVWMKDHADDTGLQPHSLNPIWASPDIKVCPTAVECSVSQNPRVGQRNYIFVKLRNPGPYGSPVLEEGYLEVWRTNPGGGAIWPDHWTQIGWRTVPVAAPGVTTAIIPWDNVPGPGHFCLVARWVSFNDPILVEGPDININTRYNNNIAWRNVDSVALTAGGLAQVRPFNIGNTVKRVTRNSVVFSEEGAPLRAAGGRLVADLGSTLYQRWVQGGKVGKGVRDLGRNQIEIVEPAQASLDNLTLNPGERLALSLSFSATTAVREPIAVNVTQFGPDNSGAENADLGGVRYDITVGQRTQAIR